MTPDQTRHLTESYAAKTKHSKAKPPNPFKWLKRQSWRFLIAYLLIRTAADFAPMLINHAQNQIQAELQSQGEKAVAKRIQSLNPFESGNR